MSVVRWRPEVSLDLLESLQFYGAREPGLGGRFMAHADAAIAKPAASPQLYHRFESDFRRTCIEVFPSSVLPRTPRRNPIPHPRPLQP